MTLAKIPIMLEKVKKANLEKQILRTAILAKLDAINLYEQTANLTENKDLEIVLLDVVKEQKEHVGEFQYLLLKNDPQRKEELEEGKGEVKQLIGEK